MSGIKDRVVQLRSSEYNRLMRSAKRVDNFENEVNNRMNTMKRDLQRQEQQRLNKVNQRMQQQERSVAKMGKEMRSIEQRSQKALKQQRKEFQNKIENERRERENLSDRLNNFSKQTNERFHAQRQEYTSLIQEQAESFSQALSSQRQELQVQINDIDDRLRAKEASERERATSWQNDIHELVRGIEEGYRIEKFKPGAADKLQVQLQMAKTNIRNSDYQAAIATNQQNYVQANELRLELEVLEQEWLVYLQEAQNQAAEALATSKAQENCKFSFETEDGPVDVSAEVDHWTNDELSALQKELEQENQRLKSPDSLSTEELKASLTKTFTLQREVLLLAEVAKQRILASQQRQNMTQNMMDVLEKSGFMLQDDTYQSDDERDSFHARFKNLQGDEIVTIVAPEELGNQAINNRLQLHYFDHNTNSGVFSEKMMETITTRLEESGLECGTPTCVSGTENKSSNDHSQLNFDRIRKKTKKQRR